MRSKIKNEHWYRYVWAETPADAKQDALAYVLNRILPDSIDDWRVVAHATGKANKDHYKEFDVHIDFHRVVHDEMREV